jgi:uncharacterized Zn finger protein
MSDGNDRPAEGSSPPHPEKRSRGPRWDRRRRKPPPDTGEPRPVTGGIKARSQEGAFGENWWARRWIAVLEGFRIGSRLVRGREYAREGQVISMTVEKGQVRAEVQGSRPKPYKVRIRVKALEGKGWRRVAAVLGRQAMYAAKLLAGEMPRDIERAFRQAGQSLFPTSRNDLSTSCTCPDWSNPCKHVAAVYYLLGEEFDRNPFLIFRMRGIEREDFLAMVSRADHREEKAPASRSEPLAANPEAFWQGQPEPPNMFGEVRAPAVTAPLVRNLGTLPFWHASQPIEKAVEAAYATASSFGINLYLGPQAAAFETGDE